MDTWRGVMKIRAVVVSCALLLGLAGFGWWSHPHDEEAAVRETLEHYLAGHATGDGAHMRMAFHSDALLHWVDEGALRQRAAADYIAGFTGRPAPDEADRRRWIEEVDVTGTAASAKIVLDYPSGRFVDYMSLLRVDGEWKIVNKIFHRAPRSETRASPPEAQSPLTGKTRSLTAGAASPPASLADVGWLAGRWVGEGLGATVEEVWLPPVGDAMTGVFRLVREGRVDFYEIVTLAEEEGSLVLSLKHFHPDLTGWEERDEVVRFPLVHHDADTWWFDGLTIQRAGPDDMRIWVALGREGDRPREALFAYRREAD